MSTISQPNHDTPSKGEADDQAAILPPTDKATTPTGPASGIDAAKMPGHWLLARMGKRVLRPGGRALTETMLSSLAIGPSDDVVELAPGLGETTRMVIEGQINTYTGIERDEQAALQVKQILTVDRYKCRVGTAQNTGLDDNSATVLFGEAFLTMQSDDHKHKIAAEAFRILRPGGRYGLHEMCLKPSELSDEERDRIRGELSRSIHVGARPLTVAAWRAVLEDAGFQIIHQEVAPMGLLHPRQLIADEGLGGAAKIIFNLARDRQARQRVTAMRSTFNQNADHLGAITLTAVKPAP